MSFLIPFWDSFTNFILNTDFKTWLAIAIIPILKIYQWLRKRYKGVGKRGR